MDEIITATLTKLTDIEIALALKKGWGNTFKVEPSIDTLAILWAQTAQETAEGLSMFNFNFGNIKHTTGHAYCFRRAWEYINGKKVWFESESKSPQCMFNAYESAEAGATEYIAFLSNRTRYHEAFLQLCKGNPIKYVASLRSAGYFTDSLVNYTNRVVALCNHFKTKVVILLPSEIKEVEVTKVMPPQIPAPNVIKETNIEIVKPVISEITTVSIEPVTPQPNFWSNVISILSQVIKWITSLKK